MFSALGVDHGSHAGIRRVEPTQRAWEPLAVTPLGVSLSHGSWTTGIVWRAIQGFSSGKRKLGGLEFLKIPVQQEGSRGHKDVRKGPVADRCGRSGGVCSPSLELRETSSHRGESVFGPDGFSRGKALLVC
ncbi:hypothetical protein MPNT_40138 [Candidatus Methylacidithermus pantelleriae]|uniref:Uncharacterized protein n=1 Tax=Candidatus Methylacidithermus pantelleriae TaxID=2744239 RepID=A0A8J2BPI6_9BACT|nr:hypothetical protein MPNT_40138 [Candidatus Methylacidithermus pantelleriae]